MKTAPHVSLLFVALTLLTIPSLKPETLVSESRAFKAVSSLQVQYNPYNHDFKGYPEESMAKIFSLQSKQAARALAEFTNAPQHKAPTSPEVQEVVTLLKTTLKEFSAAGKQTKAFRCLFKLPAPHEPVTATIGFARSFGNTAAHINLQGTAPAKTIEITQLGHLLTSILIGESFLKKHGRKLFDGTLLSLTLVSLFRSFKTPAATASAHPNSSIPWPALFSNKPYSLERDVKTKFTDVIGLMDAKEELQEIVNYVKNHKTASQSPLKPPRGILFEGLPGNGKTYLAKALAGEAGCAFFSISGSAFVEKYVGVGAQRARELFADARKLAPAIVFIDEIDAIGGKRGDDTTGGSREQSQTLNALLVEMDGFSTNEDKPVFVIAATNRAELLDEALKRPGRFDKIINIPPPSREDRATILNQTLTRLSTKSIDAPTKRTLYEFAQQTPGRSAAELNEVMTDVMRKKTRRGTSSNAPTRRELNDALYDLLFGKIKQTTLSEKEKERVAIRVAGQALMCTICYPDASTSPLKTASIEARAKETGFLMLQAEQFESMRLQHDLYCELQITLAGIAALDHYCGQHARDSSTANLFKKAQRLTLEILNQDPFNHRTSQQFMNEVFVLVTTSIREAQAKLTLINDQLKAETTLSQEEIYNLVAPT